jgi:uncharacterized spore protein YtfJ
VIDECQRRTTARNAAGVPLTEIRAPAASLLFNGRSVDGQQEALMKDIENLFGKAIGEIERMLNTKTVVGEPITVEGNTLIPLISVGFGFGVGAGEGTDPKKGAGSGGGTGGGGGVKPVALVVINKDGVRVESVKGAAVSIVEKIADVAGQVASAKPAATR